MSGCCCGGGVVVLWQRLSEGLSGAGVWQPTKGAKVGRRDEPESNGRESWLGSTFQLRGCKFSEHIFGFYLLFFRISFTKPFVVLCSLKSLNCMSIAVSLALMKYFISEIPKTFTLSCPEK